MYKSKALYKPRPPAEGDWACCDDLAGLACTCGSLTTRTLTITSTPPGPTTLHGALISVSRKGTKKAAKISHPSDVIDVSSKAPIYPPILPDVNRHHLLHYIDCVTFRLRNDVGGAEAAPELDHFEIYD
ncbi:hypothetical protein VKT23_001618 [Stygiomarasmius scandens]|uniref:Uncharacterized protein n=1 Tax=Marasmiellus scandens TaxID=2682957 RepID=A0ABR1K364_9AGAR